jgi:hypothetical protein
MTDSSVITHWRREEFSHLITNTDHRSVSMLTTELSLFIKKMIIGPCKYGQENILPHEKHWLLTDWRHSFRTSQQTLITGQWEYSFTDKRFFTPHKKTDHRSALVLIDWQLSFHTSKIIKITSLWEYWLTDSRVFLIYKNTDHRPMWVLADWQQCEYSLTKKRVFTPNNKHWSQVCEHADSRVITPYKNTDYRPVQVGKAEFSYLITNTENLLTA